MVDNLTELSDDELMSSWTSAGDEVAAAQAKCEEYAAEYHRRLAKAEEDRKANATPSENDQTVGSPQHLGGEEG